MIYSGESSSSVIRFASASDAAIFISSLISLALTSKAPLNTPGNASTLLIWFGKSLLPVEITLAPPALASSGKISGVGFAHAKMIASLFMVLTISVVTAPGADTPINTSAPTSISAREPAFLSRLVTLLISSLTGFIPSGRPS